MEAHHWIVFIQSPQHRCKTPWISILHFTPVHQHFLRSPPPPLHSSLSVWKSLEWTLSVSSPPQSDTRGTQRSCEHSLNRSCDHKGKVQCRRDETYRYSKAGSPQVSQAFLSFAVDRRKKASHIIKAKLLWATTPPLQQFFSFNQMDQACSVNNPPLHYNNYSFNEMDQACSVYNPPLHYNNYSFNEMDQACSVNNPPLHYNNFSFNQMDQACSVNNPWRTASMNDNQLASLPISWTQLSLKLSSQVLTGAILSISNLCILYTRLTFQFHSSQRWQWTKFKRHLVTIFFVVYLCV